MRRFADIDASRFRDAIIILDVDGTITNDRSSKISDEAVRVLRELAAHNTVYLCSNSTDISRVEALANATGTRHLSSVYRKPSARVLESLPEHGGRRIVVIGDKRLTDGLFARNIGAEFVPVRRIVHPDDRRHITLVYFLDDTYHAISSYVRLMRPTQWIKNLLVFAPLFFAGTAFDLATMRQAAFAFVAFCAAASAMYAVNDIVDRKQDAAHPLKRGRPLASGDASIRGALLLCFTLVAVATLALLPIPKAALIVGAYVLLNVAYSTYLKHIAVVDILCVASFYVMRVVAGGVATGIYISPWIILCVLFGALVLVIGKRRAELIHTSRRKALDGYSKSGLDFLLGASATLAVVSYALYSVVGAKSPLIVYSTVFVVLAVFRVVNKLYTGADSDAEFPERLLFKDPVALLAGVAWAVYMFAVLYI